MEYYGANCAVFTIVNGINSYQTSVIASINVTKMIPKWHKCNTVAYKFNAIYYTQRHLSWIDYMQLFWMTIVFNSGKSMLRRI